MNKYTRLCRVLVALAISVPAFADGQLSERSGGTATVDASPFTAMVSGNDKSKTRLMTFARKSSTVDPFRPYLTSRVNPGVVRPRVRPMEIPGSTVSLAGSVVYSDSQPQGLYKLPMTAGGKFEAIVTGENKAPIATHGGVAIDGVYYIAWQYDFYGMMTINYLESWDMETWQRLSRTEVSNTVLFATDVSLDPVSGKVYGCYFNDDETGYVFGIGDYKAKTRMPISEITVPWNGVAFDADGTLYAIDINGDLLKVNKSTGATTKVGSTGVTPRYLSSAVIDHKSGRMFWSVFGEDKNGKLYEVNKSTGVATELCHFPGNEEVCGMFVIAPEADDNAPAAVENPVLNFPDGSLTGTVDFKMPTTLFNGTPATGQLSYKVSMDDVAVSQGTAMFGDNVKAPVTLNKAGEHEFVITVSNGAGTSPKVKVSGFVGKDTPAMTKATLTRVDDRLSLSWTPVTESVNGGYMDVNDVTYTVTRYPGAVVVANNYKATSFSEAIPSVESLTSFYYTVVAKSGGLASGVAKSNTVSVGSVTPPYDSDFSVSTGLDGYSILDVNKDGKAWSLETSRAYLPYNKDLDSDDWLMSPPLRLMSGKMYKVSYTLSTKSSSFKERAEVKWGNAATPEGMTATLLEPLELATLVGVSYENYITPSADGLYYVGFHGISEKNAYGLYVDKFSVSAAIDMAAPEAVSELKIVSDYNGANKATVSFVAPSKNLRGENLSGITRIEVSRGTVVVKTFNAPSQGAKLSFEDNVPKAATYTYTVTAYNGAGAGKSVSIKSFVGLNKPAAVTGFTAVETANDGEMSFSWDEVTTDVDGNPLNPALVSYSLYEFTSNYKYVPVIENIKNTSYTYQAVPQGDEQELKQWVVFSMTSGGEGQGVQSDVIAVGPDYPMPFVESVAGGKLSYNFTSDQSKGGVWRPYTSATMPDVPVSDGDDGMFGMRGTSKDATGSIATGKIRVSGDKPGLVFYVFNINGVEPDANEVNVYIRRQGATESVLRSIVTGNLGKPGWNRVVVPLDDYVNSTVYLRFEGITKNYEYTFIDNIRLCRILDYNLAALSVSVQPKVQPGCEFPVEVKYESNGLETAGAHTVNLYRNGVKVASMPGAPLESGQSRTLTFKETLNVAAPVTNEYHAEIAYDTDQDGDDNKTGTPVYVTLVMPKHPAVGNLTGVNSGNGVTLRWDAPDLSAATPDAVTETFESGESFATEFDGWTFVDVDGKSIGGMQNITLPGIDKGSKQSFFVFDSDDSQFNSTFDAHSGTKYLAALFNGDYSAVDDWAISPRLCGEAQTISFYARSYHNTYKESIEICYSTGSLDVTEFIPVKSHENISHEWTLFTADLPAGARYFAIRSFAANAFMLLVDDVTYIPASNAEGLTLQGYNIYRDGVKINDAPVTDKVFNDNEAVSGNHTYAVSAVYDKGESAPATVTVSTSGIVDVVTDGLSVVPGHGEIVISGCDGMDVTVCDMNGRMVYAGKGESRMSIPLPAGLYVVKVADKAVKSVVR